MTYKVIQWATGTNGSTSLRAVIEHPDLELVGCRVFSDDKDGVDAGELAGVGPVGVRATSDRQAILDLDADVVLHVPKLSTDPRQLDDDIIDLLRSGKNVIDICGINAYPPALTDVGSRFESACQSGGTTFFSAGINPGFVGERLAPTLSGLCLDVDRMVVREIFDCTRSPNTELIFDALGLGKRPEDWSTESPFYELTKRMFMPVLHAIAVHMAIEIDRTEFHADVKVAKDDIQVAAGLVAAGTVSVAELRTVAIPVEETQPTLVMHHVWTVETAGEDYDPRWEVEIEGSPGLVASLRWMHPELRADHAALYVGSAVRAIPEVVAAKPGILLPTIFAPYRVPGRQRAKSDT